MDNRTFDLGLDIEEPKESNQKVVDEFGEIGNYIRANEGTKYRAYPDTEGNMTIGTGHRILPEENYDVITPEQEQQIFTKDLNSKINTTKMLFPQYDNYPLDVKKSLVDGVFRGEYKPTHKTVKYINSGEWDKVPSEYVNREDYRQSQKDETGVATRMDRNAKTFIEYAKSIGKAVDDFISPEAGASEVNDGVEVTDDFIKFNNPEAFSQIEDLPSKRTEISTMPSPTNWVQRVRSATHLTEKDKNRALVDFVNKKYHYGMSPIEKVKRVAEDLQPVTEAGLMPIVALWDRIRSIAVSKIMGEDWIPALAYGDKKVSDVPQVQDKAFLDNYKKSLKSSIGLASMMNPKYKKLFSVMRKQVDELKPEHLLTMMDLSIDIPGIMATGMGLRKGLDLLKGRQLAKIQSVAPRVGGLTAEESAVVQGEMSWGDYARKYGARATKDLRAKFGEMQSILRGETVKPATQYYSYIMPVPDKALSKAVAKSIGMTAEHLAMYAGGQFDKLPMNILAFLTKEGYIKHYLGEKPIDVEATKPEWYSKLENIVTEKMGNSMPPNQLSRMLLGAGVKPSEMKAYGLDEFIKEQTKSPQQTGQDFKSAEEYVKAQPKVYKTKRYLLDSTVKELKRDFGYDDNFKIRKVKGQNEVYEITLPYDERIELKMFLEAIGVDHAGEKTFQIMRRERDKLTKEWEDKQKPTGKISKQALLDHIAENKIEVQEVVLGEDASTKQWIEDLKQSKQNLESQIPDYVFMGSMGNGTVYSDKRQEEYGDYKKIALIDSTGALSIRDQNSEIIPLLERISKLEQDILSNQSAMTQGKFGRYLTEAPVGENYREVYLSVPPEITSKELYDEANEAMHKLHRKYGDGWRNKATQEEQSYVDDLQKEAENTKGAKPNYKVPSSHSTGDPKADTNRLAHIFLDEVTTDGKKYLRIREMQSDWAREGREKGFDSKVTEQDRQRLKELEIIPFGQRSEAIQEELDTLVRKVHTSSPDGVPYSPLLKKWQELALKKVLRIASEGKYDGITWSSGEQVADRYSLAKHLKNLEVKKIGDNYTIRFTTHGNDTHSLNGGNYVDEKTMAENIGKDLAEKVKNQKDGEKVDYSGLDLKVKPEWTTNLYDKQIPNILKKLIGKEGKVEGIDLETEKKIDAALVTPEVLREAAELSKKDTKIDQPNNYAKTLENEADRVESGEELYYTYTEPKMAVGSYVRDVLKSKGLLKGSMEQQSITLPKSTTQKIMREGQALFTHMGKMPKKHRSLSGYINDTYGGVSIDSLKALGYNVKEAKQQRTGIKISKNGAKLDDMATELASDGIIMIPYDENPADYVWELLKMNVNPFKEEPSKAEQIQMFREIPTQEYEDISFDTDKFDQEIKAELEKQAKSVLKEVDKPSVLRSKDVKKTIRDATGQIKVTELIGEREAIKRLFGREQAVSKKAYSEGKKEQRANEILKRMEDRAIERAKEEAKKAISDILKVDISNLPEPYRSDITAIQEKVDPAVLSKKKFTELSRIRDFFNDNPETELPDYVIDKLKRLDQLNRENTTLDDLKAMANIVQHYAHLAKLKNKIRIGREYREANRIKQTSIGEMKPVEEVVGTDVVTPGDIKPKLKQISQNIIDLFGINQDHYDLIVESIAGENSVTNEVLFTNLKNGIRTKMAIRQEIEDMIQSLVKEYNLDSIENMRDWRKETVKTGRFTFTRGERIALALHANNPNNSRHLLEGGFAFAKDQKKLYKINKKELDSVLESLTREEKAYMSINYHIADRLYEAADAVFYEKNGYHLPKENNYYGIKIARGALPQEKDADSVLEELKGKFVRVGLSKGFLNHRVKSRLPLVLNDFFRDLDRHIEYVSAYAGLEIPLSSASKLLYDRTWRSELENRYGEPVWKHIEKAIRDIAGESLPISDLEAVFNEVKGRAYKAIFSLNIPVYVKQALSYPLFNAYVPAKYLHQAWSDYRENPNEMIRTHMANSVEFRARVQTGFARDIADIYKAKGASQLAGEKKALSEQLVSGIQFMDKQTVACGMQGAVLQKLDELSDSDLSAEEKLKQAYEYADYVVNRTQPSFAMEHRSPMSRGNWLEKSLTFATTATNQQLNLMRRTWRDKQRSKGTDREKETSDRFFRVMAHLMATIPIGIYFVDWLADNTYRRKVKKKMSLKDFMKKYLKTQTGNVYLLRDFYNSLSSKIERGAWGGYDMSIPVAQYFELIVDTATNLSRGAYRKNSKEFMRGLDGAMELIMTSFGYPYRTPKKYFEAIARGRTGEGESEYDLNLDLDFDLDFDLDLE